MGFALSKWPHLHRAYVISGCIFFTAAVSTGEDKFCCAHIDKDPVLESQPPLFKDKNEKAYPCMDQTSHCEKWVQKFPENCEPNYDTNGFSENRYPFMREVCQESCHKRSGNFRGSKCEKVIEIFQGCFWARVSFASRAPRRECFEGEGGGGDS